MISDSAEPWLPRFSRCHTAVVVGCCGILLFATAWVAGLPLSLQIVVLAGAVGLAGLPHGALDLALLRGAGMRTRAIFGIAIGYVLLSAMVLALFATFPITALAGFLFISWLHFGLGDTEQMSGVTRGIEAAARGGVIIVAPVFFHPIEVARIFQMIAGQDSADSILALVEIICQWMAPICFALLFVAVIYRVRRAVASPLPVERFHHGASALEMTLTLVLVAFWPPLMAFLVYFCGIHSVRHLAEIGAARYPHDARQAAIWLVKESWPLTVATLLLAAGIGTAMASRFEPDSLFTRLIFQGLAALTVPHMAISFWLQARGESTPGDCFSNPK